VLVLSWRLTEPHNSRLAPRRYSNRIISCCGLCYCLMILNEWCLGWHGVQRLKSVLTDRYV
jgi:hypothetical protein